MGIAQAQKWKQQLEAVSSSETGSWEITKPLVGFHVHDDAFLTLAFIM